eukprot:TRINITY_DN4647_c0_g7_i1.p1 TRINITY_DN4647_c0_g7~~TRINITY_DN4647_c0_g7_i1.p1  ORF type:complete len:107 (-),score=3.77 TRINITY_DN4647_c0_g7_i1:255-575(-)
MKSYEDYSSRINTAKSAIRSVNKTYTPFTHRNNDHSKILYQTIKTSKQEPINIPKRSHTTARTNRIKLDAAKVKKIYLKNNNPLLNLLNVCFDLTVKDSNENRKLT